MMQRLSLSSVPLLLVLTAATLTVAVSPAAHAADAGAVAAIAEGPKEIWADFNGDGKDDLYAVTPGIDDRMYYALGGEMVNATRRLGLDQQKSTMLAHAVDLDGRGNIDLVLIKSEGGLSLWQNLGDRFQNISKNEAAQDAAMAATLTFSGTPVTIASLALAQAARFCGPGLVDQSNPGSCLKASSAPKLGKLLPVSQDLRPVMASGTIQSPVHTYLGVNFADFMGQAVANAGDVDKDGVEDFLVGTPFDDTLNTVGGRATVYSGSDGSILHDFFGVFPFGALGYSVDGAGDVNGDGHADVILGEPHGLFGGYPGFAYVHSGKTGALLYSVTGINNSDRFGLAVSASGDVNNDGTPDFVVGAPIQSLPAKVGYARVYSGVDGSQLHHFTAPVAGDWFGFAVGGAGDVDGDGKGDVVIGAPQDASKTGRMSVYSGATGAMLYSQAGDAINQQLGFSVDSAGDLNADGKDEVIAGAPFTTPYARIYTGATGTTFATLNSSASGFGYSVRSVGDATGDGIFDLLIGAPFVNFQTGEVQLISGASLATELTVAGSFAASNFGVAADRFGTNVVIGAPVDDQSLTDAGSASTFAMVQVGMGTLAPQERLHVAGVVESSSGGFKFPDSTVQTSADQPGLQGPAGAAGPQGPQGPTGPPASSGILGINGLDFKPLSLVGSGAASVSSSGSTITVNVGTTKCTEGSKQYSPGAICYFNTQPCTTGFGFTNQRKTCQTDGTWAIGTIFTCTNPSLTPICGI